MLIVDDEPLIATLLCDSMCQQGFDAVARHSAVEARKAVVDHDPDVVLVDINLGDGPSGVQFGQWLHKTHPHIAQVFLTNFADPKTVGLDHWDLPPGGSLLSKKQITEATAVVEAVELALQEAPSGVRHDLSTSGPLSGLTKTQFVVIQLAAQGLTNSAIAVRRNTSQRSVEQHLQAVYQHFGLTASDEINLRTRAVRTFIEAGGMPNSASPVR